MVKKGTHRGSIKDGGAVGADASRKATAPRRQPPHGVEGERRRQSPSSTPRRGRRQSPSAIALFLSKKRKGKLVRREAPGLPRARRVPNASSGRCNRLGSVVLTLGELRRITKNFSDDQLVGEGAFGKVYKGVLTNGDMIAVKRFASTITGLQDVHYENEARHLMSLKHPNIVQLVGYCSATEMKLVRYNGKFVRAEQSERLLCLEYMPKGSLRGHLSDETSGLEWNTRYKIIEAICYGLHYLHEEWQATPIIHMDLKPANILLDDNMVPKIADFGISRLFAEEQTRTCTKNCKGTPGYMPPEYIEKGVITKGYDIFSLGVLIIEIITGVKDYPMDETETTFQQYIDLVLNNWRPRLRKAQGYTSQDIDYQQIKKCIQIGLLCVKFDPVERPTINQIIKMLQRFDEAKMQEELQARLRKHDPPFLADEVWRLEKIGKEGAFHRKLRQNNVHTVKEFVRMLMVKPDKLRAILGDAMTDKMWEATTNHSKTCLRDDKVYAHSTAHGTIYLNSIFQILRVDINGVEWRLQQLNRGEKVMVQQMLLDAYEHRHSLQEADAFMLHGHAANNHYVQLLQNAAHVPLPAPANTLFWFPNADDVVPIRQANNSLAY